LFAKIPGSRLLLIGDSTMEQLNDALECDLLQSGCELRKERMAMFGTQKVDINHVHCPDGVRGELAIYPLGTWHQLASKKATPSDMEDLFRTATYALVGFGHHGTGGTVEMLETLVKSNARSAWLEMSVTHFRADDGEYKKTLHSAISPEGAICIPIANALGGAKQRTIARDALRAHGGDIAFVHTVKYTQSRWDLHGDYATHDLVSSKECINGTALVRGVCDCLHMTYSPYLYEPMIDEIVATFLG
jgi:hypothetical protein